MRYIHYFDFMLMNFPLNISPTNKPCMFQVPKAFVGLVAFLLSMSDARVCIKESK